MKVKQILPVAAMALATLTGCESKKEMNMGIRPENMDLAAQKGADFYQYACGGWMAANPLTDEYSRFGTFDQLGEMNREQLKGLIAGIASAEHEQGSVQHRTYYYFSKLRSAVGWQFQYKRRAFAFKQCF